MSQPDQSISSMRTVSTFLTRGGCSDTLFTVLNQAFGHPMVDEERAAIPLVGGILQHGYQCGMIWGAALAAGAEAHRRFGSAPQAQERAIVAAQRAVTAFRSLTGHINCLEITEINPSTTTGQMITYFLLKGGMIGCLSMAAHFAPLALRAIEEAFAEAPSQFPQGPVSCASLLAQRMGLSECHATMTAGLAGGIGLSGGACGALGALIWISTLKSLQQGTKKVDFKSPDQSRIIKQFLECTNYEFECATITGRTFGSVAEHACHICEGGCARLLDALSESATLS